MERTATGIKQALFGSLDFSSILSNKDFKEADVRALIIDPMLKGLGFSHENILREKALQSPFLRTGSKKRKVTLIPDYALKVENGFAWVLDAKAPHQKIVEDGNVEQAYSYAAHPEIRSNYFALCNGLEFACFRTTDTEKPALYFRVEEIEKHWQSLCRLLSPESFQEGNKFVYDKIAYQEREKTPAVFDYAGKPLLPEIPVKRGAAKRHFGVHGYFTRQAWNVVAGYIKHFSSEGDTVLDPFGGSGVTAIEALVNGRKAVNVDINPLAIFMVRTLLEPVDFGKLSEGYNKVRDTYLKLEPKTKKEVHEILNKYPGPKNLPLPKGSDVATVPELFSGEQTAKLALLKALIHKEKDKNVRAALMLMFSGMVTKFNLTFHASGARTEGRGAASALMYYRYRLAREPVSLDIIESFDMRFKRVAAAKREIEQQCLLNRKTAVEMFADAQIIKGSATDLSFLKTESVDYIYTDPPYGKNIPYLDLSAMWFAWLDVDITDNDYELEVIEGGSREKSKEEYKKRIAESIQEMYRVLQFDRWLSFVFAHKDPDFWHLILDTAEKCGFEYIGAVPQKNGQTSFKKRQHPFTVLSGQLILNFRKTKNPRALLKGIFGENIDEIIMQTIEGVIAKEHGAALEQINDELIIKGLERGFLHLLKKHYSDLTPFLLENFDYNPDTEKFDIKKNKPFTTHVDEKLRINYYLTSFLRNVGTADFDTIIYEIMPLLRNGKTPEDQTILSVLEDLCERAGPEGWKLKAKEKTLFDGL